MTLLNRLYFGDCLDVMKKEPPLTEKPEIRVKPHSYQPSKAELDEVFDVRNADGSMPLPEDVARRVFRPMKIVEDSDA